jgi:hypothetical protein
MVQVTEPHITGLLLRKAYREINKLMTLIR